MTAFYSVSLPFFHFPPHICVLQPHTPYFLINIYISVISVISALTPNFTGGSEVADIWQMTDIKIPRDFSWGMLMGGWLPCGLLPDERQILADIGHLVVIGADLPKPIVSRSVSLESFSRFASEACFVHGESLIARGLAPGSEADVEEVATDGFEGDSGDIAG